MKEHAKKIIILMLLIAILSPTLAIAGYEEDPEIVDESEDDIIPFLDIISAWFYGQIDQPDFLFIDLKLEEISTMPFKQHLTVHWELNGVECAAMMAVGYNNAEVVGFSAGYGHGFWFMENYLEIQGEYNDETGVIIMKIPKSFIKNPEKGDVLTNTYALTFQRFGFIGRMGFDRPMIHNILFKFTGENRFDFAPNEGYGRDYTIIY